MLYGCVYKHRILLQSAQPCTGNMPRDCRKLFDTAVLQSSVTLCLCHSHAAGCLQRATTSVFTTGHVTQLDGLRSQNSFPCGDSIAMSARKSCVAHAVGRDTRDQHWLEDVHVGCKYRSWTGAQNFVLPYGVDDCIIMMFFTMPWPFLDAFNIARP
jgi:hypothetical protein